MKSNKTTASATFSEANNGKAFINIEVSSLPKFNESDFTVEDDDPRAKLLENLRKVVFPSLPAECTIENNYSGILATDLFSLNTLLGSMIESKVVLFLNAHRPLWDNGKWNEYHFIRSNESFPDVRLVKKGDNHDIILGIELKSWFILSKEGEPSFRYRTASEACDKGDLLCIIPWYLSDAVCGNPVLATPWVYSAKAAAEATKRYWIYERQTDKPMTVRQRGLIVPPDVRPYMDNARNKTNYKPVNDGGNNFGRLARTGIMSDFVEETLVTDILGIPAKHWMLFLKAHTESCTLQVIQKNISLITKLPKTEEFQNLMKALRDYIDELPKI